ncbi:S41 family peptidase [Halorhodospira halochloris]|uniref:S41 family peptidase n=1 Tax=Halorhodospira halochloris TaxID=1052 RepID=UPI001EE84B59|nr:S41 family peptidase [Halorhodospira halochloris]MCG5530254.1 S41 family peptidase [Halorhodospira halochloris]
MHKLRSSWLALIIATAFLNGCFSLNGLGTAQAEDNSQELFETSEKLPMAELELLTEVYGRIKRDYVDEIEDEKLFKAAIRGMLNELDAHTSYLDDEELEKLREGTRGEFGGIGLELSSDNGFVQVVAPIDETPASKAGLKTGDIITRVNGESVRGIGINRIVNKLRGEPGTKVSLTIVREGAAEPLSFELERDIIKIQSVRSRTLTPGYAYVRISQFQERTAADLHKALDDLIEENEDKGLKGMILDLRNNPGGVLNAAISVSDAFLEGGQIVYTEGRAKGSRVDFDASDQDRIDGTPLVVLINRGSASGSEIVAGSLQDRDRAIIMGQTSFGKGSVQSVVPLLGGPAMKLTTARYYTPTGQSIDKKGVVPDIEVEDLRLAEAKQAERSKEAELEGLMPEAETDDRSAEEDKLRDLARDDYVLYEALNLLRGLNIVTKNSQKLPPGHSTTPVGRTP